MNIIYVGDDCAVDGCYKKSMKGKRLCKQHQAAYEKGERLKAFYGKTIQKKEFQKQRK